ncbi:MAG TPA: acyl-CoA thioesterase [Gammaproteobacteria bacterium]|nr:acyl-CoA thioesterase [Gammaproteobacteria bacterium]
MSSDEALLLPQDKTPTLRLVPMPSDTNAAGDIFGGWIMSQVDIAGSVVAHRAAKGRVVTVAVKEFMFHQPVYVGDLVSCYADVIKIGRTSLTVFVEVFAERRGFNENCLKVTEATVTYVAVDKNGRPRPVE